MNTIKSKQQLYRLQVELFKARSNLEKASSIRKLKIQKRRLNF